MSFFTIDKAYLIKDPESRQVGDKTIVSIVVADNPRGEKAKARYVPLFIRLDFTGKDADYALGLRKGSAVAAAGRMGLRVYEKKDGTTGFEGEISYPFYLTGFDVAPATAETSGELRDTVPEMPMPKAPAKPRVDPFA